MAKTMTTEPSEQLDEEAEQEASSGGTPPLRETLKRATITAAVAAGAGALAGAAKALLERRDGSASDGDPDTGGEPDRAAPEKPQDDEPEARAEPAANEDDEDEPDARAERAAGADEEGDEQDEEQDNEPEARAEPAEEEEDEGDEVPQGGRAQAEDEDEEPEDDEPEARAKGEQEPDESSDDDEQPNNRDLQEASEAGSDMLDIVPKAREGLERLLGREAESVSGIQRTDGHWSVVLEVVELRRVPDTMDVLGSYELVLDDDGKVARMTRKRRYARSQVEGQS